MKKWHEHESEQEHARNYDEENMNMTWTESWSILNLIWRGGTENRWPGDWMQTHRLNTLDQWKWKHMGETADWNEHKDATGEVKQNTSNMETLDSSM